MNATKWVIIAGVAAVALVTAAVGITQQSSANADFTAVRESVTAPQGWEKTDENVRTAGLFGVCWTSVLDVRACPSSTDEYTMSSEYSASSLADALEQSGATVTSTDCEPPSGNGTGTFPVCRVDGRVIGLTVSMTVIGTVTSDGVVTDPRGRITIGR